MKLLLIQSILHHENDILLAASATEGMEHGLKEQTIPWFYYIYTETGSLWSVLTYMAYISCESPPPWQYPQPWYRQSLLQPQIRSLKKINILVIPTEIFVGLPTTSSFDRSFLSWATHSSGGIPHPWSDLLRCIQYRLPFTPVPTCLDNIGTIAIMLRRIAQISTSFPGYPRPLIQRPSMVRHVLARPPKPSFSIPHRQIRGYSSEPGQSGKEPDSERSRP